MFTIIYYTDDWHTAERMADAERSAKNRAGVREARVFRDAEACDKVVILPCVDADAKARIAAAYGDKVSREADKPVEPQGYEAKHRGRGSFSVMLNGVEVVEGLTKLEADAFKTYSPAEQAAFVANRAKG
jgi:hypothetical protein